MIAETYRRRVRAPFVYGDLYLRFMFNRRIPRRFQVLWGYIKIRLLKWLRPGYHQPLKLAGFRVSYGDISYLWYTYREIFIVRLYTLEAANSKPLIIDAGANIGLATLFYKYLNPHCKVVCFEPDPRNLELLQANIRDNGLTEVTIHPTALSDHQGTQTFYSLPEITGDTGFSVSQELRGVFDAGKALQAQKVACESLRPHLKAPVDVLKLDIEGSEGVVIKDIAADLPNIGAIQMEYHYEHDANELPPILEMLERGGHEYRVEAPEGLRNVPGSVAMIYTRKKRDRKRPATHAAQRVDAPAAEDFDAS